MNDKQQTPAGASKSAPQDGFNWFRFWVRVAVAALAFNVVAALVTWYFVFPKLHPDLH